MPKAIAHEIYSNVVSTIIALLIIVLTYTIVTLLIIRKVESNRQRRRYRIRSFYVAIVIFLFLMAKIWVEGFTHLLAVLGLVSAALVVTNKETIMNFVGWFIITWRELFAEDDMIQIQQHKGYVRSIGVLYFTLSEVSDGINGDITGRIIRIPNGLVTNNAVVNMSQTSHLLEQKFTIVISQDSDVEHAIQFLKVLVNAVVAKFYKDKNEYSLEYLNKHNKSLMNRMNLETKISIQPKLEKPSGVELKVRYYCFSLDAETIQQGIWLTLLESIKNEEQIKLAYNT